MADQKFDETCAWVKENAMPATDDEKLSSYKYYKQATVGDCNVDAPGGMMAAFGLSTERRKVY